MIHPELGICYCPNCPNYGGGVKKKYTPETPVLTYIEECFCEDCQQYIIKEINKWLPSE
jgi:hypothetical protein